MTGLNIFKSKRSRPVGKVLPMDWQDQEFWRLLAERKKEERK